MRTEADCYNKIAEIIEIRYQKYDKTYSKYQNNRNST